MDAELSALRGAVYEWQVALDATTAQGVFAAWKAVPADLRPVAADYLAPHLGCGPQTEAWRAALLSPESPYWVCAREVVRLLMERDKDARSALLLMAGRPAQDDLRAALRAQWQGEAARMALYFIHPVAGHDIWSESLDPRDLWRGVAVEGYAPAPRIRPRTRAYVSSDLLRDLRVANEATVGWLCAALRAPGSAPYFLSEENRATYPRLADLIEAP